MSSELLQTKLYVPRLRPSLVSRPHLLQKLNSGLHGKLTLISAPAGFGKTTMMTHWLQALRSAQAIDQTAWLSLDEEDRDPLRFITYFVAALETIHPKIGTKLAELLQSSQPPPLKRFLTTLLNQITAVAPPFLLVLDDYHVLGEPEIDEALTYVLDHLPPQMHLAIITREDPPLPLARLRARGQMTELRAADLRFTVEETAAFLNEAMGLNLSTTEIAALETRTEGWIAGLQMTALSLQNGVDTAQFIAAFTGSHRFILDYLVEEVLQSQSKQVRDFLLQTSILRRLTGSLCNAVTAQAESAKILEDLERGNLFVVPLDDERRWYRYHHLFADVLQARLLQEKTAALSTLHQRASNWFAENELPAAAIRHALAAPDYEQAANLIEMTYPALANGFRPVTWLGWVTSLPETLVHRRPVLNLGYAYGLLNHGELENVASYLDRAEQLLQPAAAAKRIVVNEEAFRTLPYNLTNARAYLAQASGQASEAIEYAQRTLDIVPPTEHYHHGLAQFFLGLAYWSSGNIDRACQTLLGSMAAMQAGKNVYFQLFVTAVLGQAKMVQGRLREAASIFAQTSQMGAEEQGQFQLRQTYLTDLYLGLGELSRERGDLETAAQHLQKGKEELDQQAAFLGSRARWGVAMARLKLSEGQTVAALELLQEAQHALILDPIPIPRSPAAHIAQIWARQGQINEALDWVREQRLAVNDALSYQREFDHLTLAKILIAQYRYNRQEALLQQALGLLGRLLAAAETAVRWGSVLEILLQQAVAHDARGDQTAALLPLARAVSLAAPEGYVRLFADEGDLLFRLLKKLKQNGAEQQAYLDHLLAAFGEQPVTTPSPLTPQPLVEPLSERELEVLQLVAEGLTNRQIADRLYLALSTIKGHNRIIYGKLNVSRRTEAVARARELGIL